MKLIICDYHPWDTLFRLGDHHFARAFLDDGWEVLWISHPVSFLQGLKPENQERMERAKLGPLIHPDGPTELVPYTRLPYLNKPLFNTRWVLENSHRYFKPPLGETLDKAGFAKPDVLWITNTLMHSLTEIADAKVVAVRIADDNVEFKNTPYSLKQMEEKLADKADVVFVTSSPLEDRLKPRLGSKLHLIRNGVNFDHFQGEFEKPDEYRDIDGPIAIYVGAIEEWFAPDWIEKLARVREDITIVLIGQGGLDLSGLEKIPNVRVLGPKPYTKIPPYITNADVGIIPFRRTRLVESVSPLKLFEFLASGLPVVSTRWKELDRLGSPALLASDADEFVKLVSRSVDERLKERDGAEYRDYARVNSWDARFRRVMTVLQGFLDA